MKIITVCGSLRFQQEMMEKMDLQGHCMLSPVYPTRENKEEYTEEEIDVFERMHKERIKMSNAILVVDVDHYIGNSTQSEIAFTKSLGKEIIYYTDMV